MPGQTAYNATKYAVRGFTEALREEMLVNGHPVGVTCVHPGGIRTGIARNGRKTGQPGPREARLALRGEAGQDDPPSKAAEIILNGASAGKARVLVGLDAHAAAPLRQARRLALPGRRRPPGPPRHALTAPGTIDSSHDSSARHPRPRAS